jgi:hypothetical protein
MLRHVVPASEERIATIIRVTRIDGLGTRLAVKGNRRKHARYVRTCVLASVALYC